MQHQPRAKAWAVVANDPVPPSAGCRPQPNRNATASERAAMLTRGIWTDSGSVASAMLTALLRSRLGFLAALDFWIRFNCGVTILRVELPESEPRT